MKTELINWLQEEEQKWEGLLDQIGRAHIEQPGVNGEWSMKDIVAHLMGLHRWQLDRFRAAAQHTPQPSPAWPAQLASDDEINAWIYETNRARSVREVLDDSDQVFQQLLAAIEGLPDKVLSEPARHLPWLEAQSIKASDFFGHFHEEHEPDIRAWLAREE